MQPTLTDVALRELVDQLLAQPVSKGVLKAITELVTKVRNEAYDDSRYGFDDTYGLFIRKMFLLTSQSYGSRVQNYFARRFGFTIVRASEDLGDLRSASKETFEFKFSFAHEKKPQFDLVQIRMHQQTTGYLILGADVARDFEPFVFSLSKEQMRIECIELGNSAHGTKTAVAQNATKELRLSVPVGEHDPVFKRWGNYLDTQKTEKLRSEK